MVVRNSGIYGLMLVGLLGGCAVPGKVSTEAAPVSAASIARYNELTALEVVTTYEKSVEQARLSGMPFLAPRYYREAERVLNESQNALGNQPRETLAKLAAQGDTFLEKGRALMAIVQYRFAKELALKQRLESRNAAKLLPEDYEKAVAGLAGLIDKVEREQPVDIGREKADLLKAMQALEVRTIQQAALRESEQINAESRRRNADKQAPQTLAEAERIYQEAATQIAAAPHDEALVARMGARALFAARHAQQVNERVGLLLPLFKGATPGGGPAQKAPADGVPGLPAGAQGGERPPLAGGVTLEGMVLQEESRLHGIAAVLGLGDLRELPLEAQADRIRRAAEELGRRSGSEQVRDLEIHLQAANDTIRQLQAQLAEREAQIKALRERTEPVASPAKTN